MRLGSKESRPGVRAGEPVRTAEQVGWAVCNAHACLGEAQGYSQQDRTGCSEVSQLSASCRSGSSPSMKIHSMPAGTGCLQPRIGNVSDRACVGMHWASMVRRPR